MARPGPQEGLGQGGPRLKWAEGGFGSKNDEKVKVLRMEFSIVENLSGLQESIFNLSSGPQLHFGEKSKNWSNFIKFTDFPPFPLFGVPWAAVILFAGLYKEMSGCKEMSTILQRGPKRTCSNEKSSRQSKESSQKIASKGSC